MESHRRIRPRNEHQQQNVVVGARKSSETRNSSGVTSSYLATPSVVNVLSNNHQNQNTTIRSINTGKRDEDENVINFSESFNDGDAEEKDGAARFLYEHCGDTYLAFRRYYTYLTNKFQQFQNESFAMSSNIVLPKERAPSDNRWTVENEPSLKIHSFKATQQYPRSGIPLHERHNLALLQFLLAPTSSTYPVQAFFQPDELLENKSLDQEDGGEMELLFRHILQKYLDGNSVVHSAHKEFLSNSNGYNAERTKKIRNDTLGSKDQGKNTDKCDAYQDYSDDDESYYCEKELKMLQSFIAAYNMALLYYCQNNDPKGATRVLAPYFFSLEKKFHNQDFEDKETDGFHSYSYPGGDGQSINNDKCSHLQGEEDDDEDTFDERMERKAINQSIKNVMSKISFLLLDCIIAWVAGSGDDAMKQNESLHLSVSNEFTCPDSHIDFFDDVAGINQTGHCNNNSGVLKVVCSNLAQRILVWLDTYSRSLMATQPLGDQHQRTNSEGKARDQSIPITPAPSRYYMSDDESSAEVKFRLMCYKSRLWFVMGSTLMTRSDNHYVTKAHYSNIVQRKFGDLDDVTRSARKELKNAMEIFHHKLASDGKIAFFAGGSTGAHEHLTKGAGNSKLLDFAPKASSMIAGAKSGISHSYAGESAEDCGGDSIGSMSANEVTSSANLGDVGAGKVSLTQELRDEVMIEHDDDIDEVKYFANRFQTKKLEGQHQFALYLKAQLEFLKENTKKSLKLCCEALNVMRHDGEVDGGKFGSNDEVRRVIDSQAPTVVEMTSPVCAHKNEGYSIRLHLSEQQWCLIQTVQQLSSTFESAIYNNNLGIVHQASGKLHLALHYYARSLADMERIEQFKEQSKCSGHSFYPNLLLVVSFPLVTAQILFNTALCAQQARNFVTAYECMARCVMASPELFQKRPRCWLRMAESCMGIHFELKRFGKNMEAPLIDEMSKNISKGLIIEDMFVATVGSELDISLVKNYPLSRALFCLHCCMSLGNENDQSLRDSVSVEAILASSRTLSRMTDRETGEDTSCMESARVALAYVCMEMDNPMSAVHISEVILNNSTDKALLTEDRRRRAAARLYVHEAVSTSEQVLSRGTQGLVTKTL